MIYQDFPFNIIGPEHGLKLDPMSEQNRYFIVEGDFVFQECTGLTDKNDREIYEGDVVSLNGNMTADDSLGLLPNGWTFDESDQYTVAWDDDLAGWALEMDTKPDSPYNAKYLNHARSLLVGGDVEIVGHVFDVSLQTI